MSTGNIFKFSAITLLLGCLATQVATLYLNTQSEIKQEKSKVQLALLKKEFTDFKVRTDDVNAQVELATNTRMAGIIAQHIKSGTSYETLLNSGYIRNLATEIKSDYIEDNVYSRLAIFNTQNEFVDNGLNKKLIRDKWISNINEGSHFSKFKSGQLVLPSEAIEAPYCGSTEKPFIAYALAKSKRSQSTVDVELQQATNEKPYYTFSIKENGQLKPYNLTHRIIVDVGCTKKTTEVEKDMVNDTLMAE